MLTFTESWAAAGFANFGEGSSAVESKFVVLNVVGSNPTFRLVFLCVFGMKCLFRRNPF